MSDRLAEDSVYFHQDVIAAASKDGIVISAIGYPRSISQSVALQTLSRLSEETSGVFIPANAVDFSVPEDSFSQIESLFDHVGKLSFMLDCVLLTPLARPIEVQLNFRSNENSYFVLVPIVLPELKSPIAPEQSVAATALSAAIANASPAAATTDAVAAPRLSEQNTRTTWTWFSYGLPAVMFSAILGLALGFALLARRRRDEQRSRDQPFSSFAYLIPVGNEQNRHKLDRTPWRIGRSRSGELTLNDTSVSMLHAEIRRDALGQFTVQALESLNGVFVNGDPVDMTQLKENDRVEIGDVAFVFTLHDEEHDQQEPTAFIHTLTPR